MIPVVILGADNQGQQHQIVVLKRVKGAVVLVGPSGEIKAVGWDIEDLRKRFPGPLPTGYKIKMGNVFKSPQENALYVIETHKVAIRTVGAPKGEAQRGVPKKRGKKKKWNK